MKILTAVGRDSTFTIGYITDKTYKTHKCISIVFLEVFWNSRNNRWGIGVGIPFIASIGILFNF